MTTLVLGGATLFGFISARLEALPTPAEMARQKCWDCQRRSGAMASNTRPRAGRYRQTRLTCRSTFLDCETLGVARSNIAARANVKGEIVETYETAQCASRVACHRKWSSIKVEMKLYE